MTQDTKAPERIWAVTGLYYTYVQDWSEGEWCQNGNHGFEYVRADLLTAAEARAEAAEARANRLERQHEILRQQLGKLITALQEITDG